MLEAVRRPTRANAYLFLTLTMLFWAGNYIVGRGVVGHVPPVTLAFFRWAGAALLMLPLAWGQLRRDLPEIRAEIGPLIVLGILGCGLFNTLQFIALTRTTATSAGIINASAPAMIALLSFYVNGERVRAVQIAGIALSFLGVVGVLSRGNPAVLAGLKFNFGDLVMLIATMIWALYTVLLLRRPKIHVLSFVAVTYAIGALVNAVLAAFEIAGGASVTWSPHAVASIGYTAVFAAFVAYLLFSRGVEIIGATRAGAFMYLVPFFTLLLAFVFLGEQPHLFHLAGLGLILTGVWLAARGSGGGRS